jgi:hypothetical protein
LHPEVFFFFPTCKEVFHPILGLLGLRLRVPHFSLLLFETLLSCDIITTPWHHVIASLYQYNKITLSGCHFVAGFFCLLTVTSELQCHDYMVTLLQHHIVNPQRIHPSFPGWY